MGATAKIQNRIKNVLREIPVDCRDELFPFMAYFPHQFDAVNLFAWPRRK